MLAKLNGRKRWEGHRKQVVDKSDEFRKCLVESNDGGNIRHYR